MNVFYCSWSFIIRGYNIDFEEIKKELYSEDYLETNGECLFYKKGDYNNFLAGVHSKDMFVYCDIGGTDNVDANNISENLEIFLEPLLDNIEYVKNLSTKYELEINCQMQSMMYNSALVIKPKVMASLALLNIKLTTLITSFACSK